MGNSDDGSPAGASWPAGYYLGANEMCGLSFLLAGGLN